MIQPAHTEIQTVHIVRLAGNGNSLLNCRNSFIEAFEIGLNNGQIQERKLISTSVEISVNGVIKVAVEVVEC